MSSRGGNQVSGPLESAARLRVAVVVSAYNGSITRELLAAALAEHERLAPDGPSPVVVEVPGAFELPVAAASAARSGRVDAVVCLGCLIRGETSHDRVIAHAVADGLTRIAVDTGIPVAFGVLTVETMAQAQAQARAGGAKGNKGAEAMSAALQTAVAIGSLGRTAERTS